MIHSSTLLTYLPRSSTYLTLYHNVFIKMEDGSWENGCIYQDLDTKEIYVRPYKLFDENNWKSSP